VYESLSPPPLRRPRHAKTSDLDRSEPEDYHAPKAADHCSDTSRDVTVTSDHSNPTSRVFSSTEPSTPASLSSSREVESLRMKIKQLEDQLSRTNRKSSGLSPPSPSYNISTTTSCITGTFHVQEEVPADGHIPTNSRTIMHKTRVFGQSHWMNGMVLVRHRTQSITKR
jgi:hypothetical protein